MHYSKKHHPDFKDNQEKWIYSWDHYTGRYATEEKIADYLYRKEQKEAEKAYQVRLDESDPILYFPECVDSINGLVPSNEDDIEREWGELGDPEDPNSITYALKRNADGEGMNWTPLFKQVGIRQTVMHKVWGLVEGVQVETDEDGNTTRTIKEGSIKVINPQSVVNWWPSTGNPEQVLVKETADTRTSVQDTEGKHSQDVYVLYGLDGWTRYEVEEDDAGNAIEKEIGSGTYEFYADTDRTIRILPIFPVEIPMPRHLGHLLALKQNHIFNKKSIRDFAIQNTSFAFLQFVGTQDQYKDFLADIDKGYRILRKDPDTGGSDHDFKSPPSDYLTTYNDILDQDKKDFYDAAFKQYGDAAKQATATEIRQESRSGIEAFLSLLVTSIDEFENACFWRLEQVYFPDKPAAWGQANVKRSQDFQPKDIEEAFMNMSSAVLNADRAGAISTKRMIERLNPEWTEEQVEDELKQIRAEQGAEPIPANMIGG